MAEGVSSEEDLEIFLNRATNMLNKDVDWEAIVAFCHKVNRDLEGPQTAIRLLVHKLQSPQERECLLALTILEACVKNCGRRFQQEIGKFRFLNEIIKVISPKYMGNQMSDRVRLKSIELLYGWSQVLSHEPKVKEAYQMLKRQGIIKYDPVHIDKTLEPLPPPPSRNSVFEDDEKSKVLSRLLRSKNADDLQAANRLIKNLVRQDAERTEKASKRFRQLETVYNNIRLLNDMLQRHQPGSATQSDKEIMKELRNNLEKERPNLFQLASLTDERDCTSFSEITKANEEVIKVMNLYDEVINKADIGSLLVEDSPSNSQDQQSFMSDLAELSANQQHAANHSLSVVDDQLLGSLNGVGDFGDFFSANSQPSLTVSSGSAASWHLLTSYNPSVSITGTMSSMLSSVTSLPSLPLKTSAVNNVQTSSTTVMSPSSDLLSDRTVPTSSDLLNDFGSLSMSSTPAGVQQQPLISAPTQPLIAPPSTVNSSVFDDAFAEADKPVGIVEQKALGNLDTLEALGKSVLEQSLVGVTTVAEWKTQSSAVSAQSKIPLNQLAKKSSSTSATMSTTTTATASVFNAGDMSAVLASVSDVQPLTNVFVPLETIQPGSLPPVIAYDKNGIKILLHFGKDRPRPDVQVMAVSTMSTNTCPIKNFSFQAAVPKVMKIKLQPASATDLPSYNPILPPAAITQVMLIAVPPQEDKIRLKFKLNYSMNGVNTTDIGDIQFSYSSSSAPFSL